MDVEWSDGTMTTIYRRYRQFFAFQVTLLNMFPTESGSKGDRRVIPFLPGSFGGGGGAVVAAVATGVARSSAPGRPSDGRTAMRRRSGKHFFRRSHIRNVADQRAKHIAYYLEALLKLDPSIAQCEHVLKFFEPDADDLHPLSPEEYLRKPSKSKSRSQKGQTHASAAGEDDAADIEISSPMVLEQFYAVADYKAQNKTEVGLRKGDVVEVVEKDTGGWWFVSVNEEQGWTPATYLRPLDEAKAAPEADDTPDSAAAADAATDGNASKYMATASVRV